MHIVETEHQREIFEQCFARLGKAPSDLKQMPGFVDDILAATRTLAGDKVLKNLFALYALEHYGQASCRSLIEVAQQAGEPSIASTCRDILRQQEAASQRLDGVIDDVARVSLERYAAQPWRHAAR